MHLEAHAGAGWVLGVLTPGGDRKLRNWCVLAAVIPDIDAAAWFFGEVAYANYHHTFGHNVFLGALIVAAATWHLRSWRAIVVALAFASHLLTDMKLSAYPVHVFWPASHRAYEFHPNLGLAAPINTWLVYASMAVAALLGFVKKVTPLDVISSRLDRIFVNAFREKTERCASCERATNEVCDRCAKPTCLRHGAVDLRFFITCAPCSEAARQPQVM